MSNNKENIKISEGTTAEGKAMDLAFKKAARKAVKEAFTVRKTIMIEKDGWLVMVNEAGDVMKKVKRVARVKLPSE